MTTYCIGIDPGVNTGVAVWDVEKQKFINIQTMNIIGAMKFVAQLEMAGAKLRVRMEDARLRRWFGSSGREQLQGAGSIKRDCQIWELHLSMLKIPLECVAPKNNKTKLDAKTFAAITGWKARTSEHSRDAAMLVFQIKK